MRRREVMRGLLAASLPTRTLAQNRARIAILHSGFPNQTPIGRLFDSLGALGYRNTETASLELLGGEGNPDRLKALVEHLAEQKPDLIVALTSPAVMALKRAGLERPVVFAFVPDPVGLGIVESLARPGGNYTGVTYSEAELGGKRLELLMDALPGIRRVAVLSGANFPENAPLLASVQASALQRGVEVLARELHGPSELGPGFDAAARAGSQAAIFMTDNLMFAHRREVANQALVHKLPSIHSFAVEATDGGLMAFGADLWENYRRAAALADRILKGTHPRNIPVEQPTKFELVLNLETARALGIEFPPTLLARADEVIE